MRVTVPPLAAIASLAAVLLTAHPASAGVLSAEGGRLTYRAVPGDSDGLLIEVRPAGQRTHLVVTASANGPGRSGVTAGPGCEPARSPYEPPPGPFGPEPPALFLCPVPPFADLTADIDVGDGDDSLTADPGVNVTAAGEDGNDQLRANGRLDGGAGDDTLEAVSAYAPPRLYGGPGDDALTGSRARDLLNGGPGRDVFKLIEQRGARDGARDTVDARDGELDFVSCRTAERLDRLLLDGTDWAKVDTRKRCNGLVRASPARALPAHIDSPNFEINSGTWVGVHCPHDIPRACRGTIRVQVAGRTLGPARFRLRRGGVRDFKVARGEYSDPLCENDIPARVTVRTRRGRQMLAATDVLLIPACPYDST
jgi:hypothetical protein